MATSENRRASKKPVQKSINIVYTFLPAVTPKKSFAKAFNTRFKKAAVLVGSISAFFILGYTLAYNEGLIRYDKEKSDLNNKNYQLTDSIRRLKTQLYLDQINKQNWLVENSTKVSFNKTNPSPTLTLATTTYPCVGGQVTDCWALEKEVFKDDTLTLKIMYGNDMAYPIPNVSVGFNCINIDAQNKFIFRGGILVGGRPVEWAAASAFYSMTSKYKLEIIPKLTEWYKKGVLYKELDGRSAMNPMGLSLGTVAPQERGDINFNFKVVNIKSQINDF